MQSTLLTLAATQASRASTFAPHAAKAPIRAAVLEGWRQRNAFLDGVFYDVSCVSTAEAKAIAPWLAAEGAILVVPPTGGGDLILCPTIADYTAIHGPHVRALAVAGVGSSALGAAAFARNVADATGWHVAAVVSGYGMADLLTEAVGGFFWFGALNGIRHAFEPIDLLTEANHKAEAALAMTDASVPAPVRESRDTRTVTALLSDAAFRFDLLTGHSKGNLVLSEALYEMQHSDRARLRVLAEQSRIVTISARVAMPHEFRDVIDIMGALDWFGGLNSRPSIPADILVPFAWHHTNTQLPASLNVTQALRSAMTG
ncbi:hypothetical protein EOD42_05455 [Rhodovarius crocodyli]|uniref:Uncharacterized protein n=1 Tax=Rhodovarius crocodyli TaxID=1979269 RepID=A0A437MPG0_9PROT|nr:hypothetical protein [Rhodovarius crocodyli]RVT99532.1 hypothetical protein EOD42_05455 [Rhodovarius crocodyli]